jgi:hypothetical protein
MKPVRKIAFALLAILLVVGVIAVVSSQTNLLVTTRTDRFTTTTTSFVTVTSTSTALCDTSSTLHCVVFQQTGACSDPEFWGIPWSVTIGGTTEVQPPGTQLPPDNGSLSGLSGTLNENLTVIVFSLPDGTFQFRVSPSADYFTPESGTVDVNGTDVLIQIAYTGTSCTAVVTTTNSSTAQTQSVTPNPSLGLRLGLQISVNATGALSIETNESNLLDRVNNVTTANDWPYPNTDSLPCGDFDQFPIEYAVLQGYYGTGNYTSASALTVYNTGVTYSCPTMTAPIPYFLFAPLSDNASFLSGPGSSYLLSADYTVTGYWTGSGTFHQFPPGVYTALVEDEWGDVVLLHFTEG